jgi:hypothetical protein
MDTVRAMPPGHCRLCSREGQPTYTLWVELGKGDWNPWGSQAHMSHFIGFGPPFIALFSLLWADLGGRG